MRKFAVLTTACLSLGVLGLSACGFTPMHSPQALSLDGAQPLQMITVDMKDGKDVNDKEAGFFVLQRLRDRVGTNSGKYTLTVTPSWRRGRLGISANDVASRYDGTVTANYVLTETKTGNILDRGRVTAVSTFAASRDPYGVIASNDNAIQTTAAEAADRLIVKLAGYFSDSKDAPEAE
ncbi:hypothetical protein [Litorimonas sp.]|uniref:hypothetical protein n=1 Tax=Litorimonas sp. TaxID=1892381 RepID=UPI003A86A555